MNFSTSSQRSSWILPPSSSIAPSSIGEDAVDALVQLVPRLIPLVDADGSTNAQMTAMAYIRRFFLLLDDDRRPADGMLVVLCSIYLAGKVEELPPPSHYTLAQRGVDVDALLVSAAALVPSIIPTKAEVIRFEMRLLKHLKFQLICYHPLRPARFIKQACGLSVPSDTDLVNMCLKWYLRGNYVFIHLPAVLGCAALLACLRHDERASAVVREYATHTSGLVPDTKLLDHLASYILS
jgi:hypothetical protein